MVDGGWGLAGGWATLLRLSQGPKSLSMGVEKL